MVKDGCSKYEQVAFKVRTCPPSCSIYCNRISANLMMFLIIALCFCLNANFWLCTRLGVWFHKYSPDCAVIVDWSGINVLFSYTYVSIVEHSEKWQNQLWFIF